MPVRLTPAVQATLFIIVVLYVSASLPQLTLAQGAPIHLGDNTEYVGPHLWAILQRHADGKAVPDFVLVEIGYRTDLEINPTLEEFISSVGGDEVAEYTWRIPTRSALSVIQRPDLLNMAQPTEATEGQTDPYPMMDDTLTDIVVAYAGGVTEEHAARYAMFIREGSVVLEIGSPDGATAERLRSWLNQRNVYVPPASDFAAFSDDYLLALVPVSRLATLAEAFPATLLLGVHTCGAGASP